jgi:hypothetical protein
LLLTFVALVCCACLLRLFVAHFCCACLLLTFVALVCCSLLLLNSFRFLVPRNDKILEEFCHCFANSLLVSDRGGISVCCSRLLLTLVNHFCCSTCGDSSFLGMTGLLLILSFRQRRNLCLLLLFVAHICCSTRLDSSFLGITKHTIHFVIPTEEESLFVAHFCCSCLLLTFIAHVYCSCLWRFLVPRNDKKP